MSFVLRNEFLVCILAFRQVSFVQVMTGIAELVKW